MYFTWGAAEDAAKFEDTVSQLARHVGTQPWKLSSVASKAMSAIKAPVITSPARPSRQYWTDETRLVKINDKTSGTGAEDDPVVDLDTVKEEWEHLLDVDDYKIEQRSFQEREAAWKENRAKCYYLVLSHCPKELEQELRNSTKGGGDGSRSRRGGPAQDDQGHHPQQEREEGERDDDRGERR